jgi:electron transport complex protein RnfE
MIATNCTIIGRAETSASKNNVARAGMDGVTMGVGFTLVLVTLGGLRELLGHGTLFSQAELMFGEAAQRLTITIMEDYNGFLLVILSPSAFFWNGAVNCVKKHHRQTY